MSSGQSTPASDSRRFEITVCPDCGNHQTAFALCSHQRGAEDESMDRSKFVKMWVAPVSELERVRTDERRRIVEALRAQVYAPADVPAVSTLTAIADWIENGYGSESRS